MGEEVGWATHRRCVYVTQYSVTIVLSPLQLHLHTCIHLCFVGGDLAASMESQAPPVQIPPPVQMPPPSLTLNQTRILSKPAQQFQPLTAPTSFRQDSGSVGGVAAALPVAMPTSPPTIGGGQIQLDSTPQSLRSSQTSLTFKPDVLVGGSQADIVIRTGHGFQKPHYHYQISKQPSIDAHVDPQGQIAIVTDKGSQVQRDLSLRTLQSQQAAMQKSPASISIPRGPLQYGAPLSSIAQPAPATFSSSLSWNPQVPTSISPKRGGTVSWGVPPSSTPKQTAPSATTAVPTAQSKSSGVSLAHSSSAPSLIKPPNSSMLPRLGQEPIMSGLPQPFGHPSLNFGGSTNPLSGELKRSEPFGDLTQIRSSAPKSSSPAGGGSGSDIVRHQPSSVSVPNVAMTTKSDSPVSLGSKFVSSLGSGIAPLSTSPAGPAPFPLRGMGAISQKPPSGGVTGPPTNSQSSSVLKSTTISPPQPFTTGMPGASKSPPIGGGSTTATQPVFPFGAQSNQSGFTFTLGSSTIAPKSLASPFAMQATPTATKQTSGGSGFIFASMPKFNLGTGVSPSFQLSGSPFSASSSAAVSSTQPSSKTMVNSPSLGSGLKSPFPSTFQPIITTVSAKSSTVTTSANTLSSSLQTTAAPPKPFSFAPASTSGFVFGDNKGVSFGLSSLPKKVADTPKSRDKGETEEDSENGSTSGSADASGNEEQPSGAAFKPSGDVSKQVSTTETSTLAQRLLPSTHSAVQKLPSEGVSKTIPQIVKPAPLKSPQGESKIDAAPETSAKPKQLESKNEQETLKIEQKTEAKPSPSSLPPAGVAEVKAQQAEVSKPTPSKSVTNVEIVEKPKLETAPQTVTTIATAASDTALPGPSQAPQVAAGTVASVQPPTTTASIGTDKSPPQPTSLPKDSQEIPHPQDQLPCSEAPKKLEGNVEKVLAPKADSVDKAKETVLMKPAQAASATTATTGAGDRLSFVGMQTEAKMKSSGSQSSLLSVDDADTEADMEGEMEGTLNVCNFRCNTAVVFPSRYAYIVCMAFVVPFKLVSETLAHNECGHFLE